MRTHHLFIVSLFLGVFFLTACHQKNKQAQQLSEVKYNPKVAAFTSGMVSVESEIMVRFTDKVKNIKPGDKASSSILKITPSIKGDYYWADNQSLVFKPEESMKSGTIYSVKVDLNQVFTDAKDDFSFEFQTIPQNFRVELEHVTPYINTELKDNKLQGKLILSNVADIDNIHKMLSAEQDDKKLDVEWLTSSKQNQYPFIIHHIKRSNSSKEVHIKAQGDPINTDKVYSHDIDVPDIDEFNLLNAKIVLHPRQAIEILFSDPINPDANLNGLIKLEPKKQFTTEIEDNIIRIFPSSSIHGNVKLTIYEGIENVLGAKNTETETYDLTFTSTKPQVSFLGKGVILPESDGLNLPFKAVSLKEVQVRIIKIFENNVGSFLQVNKLDGSYQLKRAGRLILKKTIPLNTDKTLDLNQWNTFSLNLDDLIRVDRGSIYRVELCFARKNAIYPCANNEEESPTDPTSDPDEITEDEIAYYDNPQEMSSYWDNSYYNYNYSQRNDPCYDSYYRPERFATRNILASNLGIIAKKGTSKEMVVAVTDLRTTKPMSNVDVDIYNYQNQLISTSKTNNEGLVKLDVKAKPYLLIAKFENQRGYLKLDDASSLSLSRFDVSGQTINKGLKGYIYGERGVWRPGDTLFVSLILEDRDQVLPKNHPVIFDLKNPYGQIVNHTVSTKGVDNMFLFEIPTEENAPTGDWTAHFTVGGTSFSKILKVETIKPNRLKIKMDFGVDHLSVNNPEVKAQMAVTWLHGAVAKNLEAKVTATLSPIPTKFKKYGDFTFDDPSRSFSGEEITLFEGNIDNEGKAEVSGNLEVGDHAPGMLKASFRTRVFEESGDFSIDHFSIPYSPYSSFVGVKIPAGDKRGMLETDKKHTIEVATVDSDGNPISRKNLKYVIYKVSWRWWWESGEDNLAQYVSSSSERIISSGHFDSENGIGKFDFEIKYPDWGRYLVRVFDPVSNHVCGKTMYVDWPGYANKPLSDDPDAATMLTLSTEKDKYQVGEKAVVNFASSENGRALVSIENGSKVLKEYWAETQKEYTSFSFDITKDMTPNIYVHVTLLQPHSQTANNLPIRMYGITPLLVEDAETHLKPVIKMPDTLLPEENVTINVSEENGNPMTYTLAVVEDGLLDLTRFKTPQPWDYFYAREALGVKTWDIYNEVIGAYGGEIEKVFSIGGDGDLSGKKTDPNANRFKPVVKVLGPFKLNKGETQKHTFKMPQYIGSVRTMVVARNERQYGNAEKTTPVKKPLMVLATLPRVLGPGESVKLPVTVFSMSEDIKNVKVSLECNDMLKVEGSNSKSISFSETGDQIVDFNLQIPKKLGIGKVKVIAQSGNKTAENEIEIQVRNPNSPRITSVSKAIKGNEKIQIPYDLFGMNGTNKATLEVSSIPSIDFGSRLKYLLQYPHGCVEQTTSSVFPQLYLDQVMDLNDHTKATIEENIKAGISRLSTFITSDGGLSYWPGESESNDWGTSYAGHFLLEAKKKGYTLPINFKSKWILYQRKAADNWMPKSSNHYSDLNQAYRLYTLALAGKPDKSSMNRMHNLRSISSIAKWRLAAAYALIGQNDVAESLIEPLDYKLADNTDYYYSYGSELRNQAMILETMSILNKVDKAAPLMQEIAEKLGSSRWMSTQTTAYSLIAISSFTKGEDHAKIDFSINGKGISNETVTSDKPIYQQILSSNIPTTGNIGVKNNNESVLFARLILEGIPFMSDTVNESSNLNLKVKYTDLQGNRIDVSSLPQGTDFKAIVTISHPGQLSNYTDMALTQIFPSGWEIRNTRMEDAGSVNEQDIPDYRDIRDDRVYSYFDLNRGTSKTFVVLLNASYLGRFYLPSVSCEAMYNNQVTARRAGQWVEVVDAK